MYVCICMYIHMSIYCVYMYFVIMYSAVRMPLVSNCPI